MVYFYLYMARKNGKQNPAIPQETKRAIIVVLLVIVGFFLVLAAFGAAGVAGSDAYRLIASLLGVGYFLVPLLFFVLAGNALRAESGGFSPLKIGASAVFFIAGLGFIQIVSDRGGMLGNVIAMPAIKYFDIYASLIVLGGVSLMSLLVLLEGRISLAPFTGAANLVGSIFKKSPALSTANEPVVSGFAVDEDNDDDAEEPEEAYSPTPARASAPQESKAADSKRTAQMLASLLGTYTPPPLSLLEHDKGRPGVGDIKGNANIIKRTLQNFGIQIELDEISIGPTVTRYAIKPAEGVRLSKIVALQQNLALALAAKGGIRIEAPIPGKSLVGIEVPNTAKVTVGLGSILSAQEFAESHKPLMVAMGRDIAGGSVFANVAKMPHALIAGATGSGKSVAIHTLITSLLYRCGPSQLRFIFIDPKRVELTLYRSLPHLLTPVITDAKKAIMALRWAGKEMERRYNILEQERVRDVESYHQTILAPKLEALRKKGGAEEGETVPEAMPYIVIVIDELADIMSTFPRELEAAIVRLAQMSRAVGIHLVLSTQRPSVNVITGLIKANVPARVALQVASGVDSRTILDQTGAENLLGAGDMLYLSADMSKPVRLQSAYISETEVKKIVDFIAQNNEAELPVEMGAPTPAASGGDSVGLGSSTGSFGDEDDVDEDMIEQARRVVLESGKASTSFLQRRLSLGYARAARIMDALEAKGIIGPANGAKPREILDKSSSPGQRDRRGDPRDQNQVRRRAIMKLGDSAKVDVDVVPSGSIGLDWALGIGGYPRGRISKFLAPSHPARRPSRSTLLPKRKKRRRLRLYRRRARARPGVCKKNRRKARRAPGSSPTAASRRSRLSRAWCAQGKIDIIVVDSVAALTPKDEIEATWAATRWASRRAS
jgi:S-DNA-T family DNA segregation ATPase FtsK/SpoIIIE